MDSPEPPRKPRWFVRWFSPLRWRFWLLTFPFLNFLVVVVLFTWPGLVFEWRINDEFYIERTIDTYEDEDMKVTMDMSYLEAGPLSFLKSNEDRKGQDLTNSRFLGFYANNWDYAWITGYDSDALKILLSIDKNWSPWK